MATTIDEAIKQLSFQFVSEGADKVAGDLNKVAQGQSAVATTASTTEKATLNLDKAFNNLERSLISGVRNQQNYQRDVELINRAVAQTPALQERANAMLAASAERYGQTGTAARALQTVLSGVNGQILALSAGAGPVGVFLSSLGPWGVAAAAGIGLVTTAFNAVRESADRLGDKAIELRKFAETTGLTITQIQALGKAGVARGVEAQETVNAVEKFVAAMAELRDGSGAMLTAIRKIDPALAELMQRTKDPAQAFNLLAQAITKADEAGETFRRNQLARAAGGRGGAEAVIAVSQAVAQAGGVQNLKGGLLDDETAKRLATLKIQVDALKKSNDALIASLGTEQVLNAALAWEQFRQEAIKTARDFDKEAASLPWWQRFLAWVGRGYVEPGGMSYQPPGMGTPSGPGYQGTYRSPTADQDLRNRAAAIEQGAPAPKTAAALAEEQKRLVAGLGEAATQTDQLRLRQKELNAEVEAGTISRETADKNLRAYNQTVAQSNAVWLQSIGVATEAQIIAQKTEELRIREAKSIQLTNEQRATATAIIQREAKAQAEANQVRAAAMPQLKQMELDYGNLGKQLDTFATTSLNNLSTALVNIMTGSVSAREGIKQFSMAVVKAVDEMIIKFIVLAPLAKALQSAFGGFNLANMFGLGGDTTALVKSAQGNVFVGGNVIPFRRGGIIDRPVLFPMARGMGLAGEAGPEAVVPLARTPTGQLGIRTAPGGGGVNVKFEVKNYASDTTTTTAEHQQGPDGEVIVLSIVKKGMSRGAFDDTNASMYGLRRRKVR